MLLTDGHPAEPESFEALETTRRREDCLRALFRERATVDVQSCTTAEALAVHAPHFDAESLVPLGAVRASRGLAAATGVLVIRRRGDRQNRETPEERAPSAPPIGRVHRNRAALLPAQRCAPRGGGRAQLKTDSSTAGHIICRPSEAKSKSAKPPLLSK